VSVRVSCLRVVPCDVFRSRVEGVRVQQADAISASG
jgi:hypothetical protein